MNEPQHQGPPPPPKEGRMRHPRDLPVARVSITSYNLHVLGSFPLRALVF